VILDAVRSQAGTRLTEVELWTDGACSGNPGPGGWAALLRMGGHERELSGGEHQTTNNRMELKGVLEGLRALSRPCRVRVHLDSSYVKNAFTNGWIARWQRNGWKSAGRQPVKNQELWQELVTEVARHEVEWVKVRGHSGVELNERVDALACVERDRYATRPEMVAEAPVSAVV
jgi:ribonuclease HI